jgi:cytochrome d ubiquinol oxidase subunit II
MAPEAILLVILWLALTFYVLFGGADFGAGIWEVNTALLSSEKERELLYRAIGPVWEANHVWLIFVLVCLHTAFPVVFAALCRALWLPLLLALVGIVFRGAAYAFRSHAVDAPRQRAVWGGLFALASAAAPFFLGAAAGAVASGRLAFTPEGRYHGDVLTGWVSPLAMFNGFFTVGVCAFLAAVYLTREARQEGDDELAQLWRQRALATGMWMGVLSLAGLVFLASESPALWQGFRDRALPLVVLALVGGMLSLLTLWMERFTLAIVSACSTVTCVLWGWAVAQYPVLLPPSLSAQQARSPDAVLWAMIAGIVVGTVLLAPSLWWLIVLFKGQRQRPPAR